jgi:hypothetical protein
MMNGGVSPIETSAWINAAGESPPDVDLAQDKDRLKLKFTPEEDDLLCTLVHQYGLKDWIRIASLMETRNARQCRERYKNYLNPNLRQGDWTREEDELLQLKYLEFGAKWNKIARFFINRSDNALRNRWMMLARHRAKEMGNSSVRKVPPSPPCPQLPRMTLPVVLPITKSYPLGQTRLSDEHFECLKPLSVNSVHLRIYSRDGFLDFKS